jgi:hypothetical protein
MKRRCLDAKRKILAGMKVEVAREVSYQLLGPEQKAALKACSACGRQAEDCTI